MAHGGGGSLASQRQRGEAAGQLRYLSIRLLGYVAELPNRSLPPRGHVPWSSAELEELGHLAHLLTKGERDAERAASSLSGIDLVFRRPAGETAPSDRQDEGTDHGEDRAAAARARESALLERYLAHRALAMDALPRLQRLVDAGPPAGTSVRSSPWRILWDRTMTRFRRPARV